MFAGFNMQLIEEHDKDNLYKLYEESGSDKTQAVNSYERDVCLAYKYDKNIKGGLDKYVKDNVVNVSELESNWFPDIDADIFLSHSHQDEEFIIEFAALLYAVFGLKAFIDSCVWLYCDELLRKIDDSYCQFNNDNDFYDYKKRNQSTSHVHMLLNGALTKMIDSTECFIFVGTSNSIHLTPSAIKEEKYSTYSPWIYSELLTSRIIEHKTPSRLINKLSDTSNSHRRIVALSEGTVLPKFEYESDFSHLCKLTMEDLRILESGKFLKSDALDKLYRLKNVI